MTYRALTQSLLVLALLSMTAAQSRAQADMTATDCTITVSGSGVVNLCGRTLVFSPTAELVETSGGRIAAGQISTTRVLGAPTLLNVAGFGLTISSWADLGETTVIRGHSSQTVQGNPGITRYFQVIPTNNSGLNADLIFKYSDGELNGIPEGDLGLFSSEDATTWTPQAGVLDVTDNTLSISGLDHFSSWTGGTGGPTLLAHVFFVDPEKRLFSLRMDRYATYAPTSQLPGGGSSSNSPAVAVFQDQQYIAVKAGTNTNIFIKSRAPDGSFADSTWTQVEGSTSAGPALCAFGDRLYLFAKDVSGNTVSYKSMDTLGDWSGWSPLARSLTAWRPSAVVFDSRLYYFEADAYTNRIWYKSMDSLGIWTDWSMIPTGSTNAAPTPIVQGGKIWLFAKGLGGKLLWWCASPTPESPTSWSPWNQCAGSSEAAPGVAVEQAGNVFHLVVRGNMVPRLWHRTLDANTLVWSNWHLLTNVDPAAQSIDSPTVFPTSW